MWYFTEVKISNKTLPWQILYWGPRNFNHFLIEWKGFISQANYSRGQNKEIFRVDICSDKDNTTGKIGCHWQKSLLSYEQRSSAVTEPSGTELFLKLWMNCASFSLPTFLISLNFLPYLVTKHHKKKRNVAFIAWYSFIMQANMYVIKVTWMSDVIGMPRQALTTY